jgi:hypothetical protein
MTQALTPIEKVIYTAIAHTIGERTEEHRAPLMGALT